MKANGGFPPININKKKDSSSSSSSSEKSKSKQKSININLKIKNILSDSKIKPMIELDKKQIEVVNDL